MNQMRFDPDRGIYRDCRWCQGRGCLYCESEADKAYKAEFPDGPVLLGSFNTSTAEGIAQARAAIGAEAMNKAFGPGGGGVAEIIRNIAKVKATPP